MGFDTQYEYTGDEPYAVKVVIRLAYKIYRLLPKSITYGDDTTTDLSKRVFCGPN